jgi:uncharacterized protein (DUF433 family)
VDGNARKDFRFPRLLANPIAGSIGAFQRLTQRAVLVVGWKQLHDGSQFHSLSIADLFAQFKALRKEKSHLPPPAFRRGFPVSVFDEVWSQTMAEKQEYAVAVAHITRTPGVCGGKPCIAGRRIRVQDVYLWHEVMGMDAATIAREYDLTLAQVHAALTYAFDDLPEILADIQESDAIVEQYKTVHPTKLHLADQ